MGYDQDFVERKKRGCQVFVLRLLQRIIAVMHFGACQQLPAGRLAAGFDSFPK